MKVGMEVEEGGTALFFCVIIYRIRPRGVVVGGNVQKWPSSPMT